MQVFKIVRAQMTVWKICKEYRPFLPKNGKSGKKLSV